MLWPGWGLVFGALVKWRFHEARDETKNNWGYFQHSSMFYREGGAMMDCINALSHIINLVPTATVYLGLYYAPLEQTGHPYWTFLTLFAGFGLVPLLDLFIDEDSYNPTPVRSL